MKLLDTDTCIGVLRGRPEVLSRYARVRGDEIVTTWVTAGELFFGAARSVDPESNARHVGEFLTTLPVLGLDFAGARVFGELKALLRRQGNIVADADLLIASIALAQGAIVVTGNERHFDRMPGLEIENWLRSEESGSQ